MFLLVIDKVTFFTIFKKISFLILFKQAGFVDEFSGLEEVEKSDHLLRLIIVKIHLYLKQI
ncbi:hypothetical protein CDL62_12785 [Alkalitalea saponilacus]|nr:hypothetical protein CDL62_12785 [Alkalitalea saponilacus]